MKNLARLNHYFWKYRGRFFMGILFIALTNLGNVGAPAIVKDGVDFLEQCFKHKGDASARIELPTSIKFVYGVFGKEQTSISGSDVNVATQLSTIGLLLAFIYLLIYLVKGVFLFYQRQTIIVMSRYIEYDMKNEIYDHYQKLDMGFYKRNRTGDLMNRISEDVNRVRMYLGPAVMYTINLAVLSVFCIFFMLKENVELTLWSLSPMPFMMICIFYVSKTINRRTDKVQSQQSKLSAFIQEAMSGVRVLKAYGMEDKSQKEFAAECDTYKDRQLQLVKVDSLFMPVIVLLVGMGYILAIYVGGLKVMSGEITAGTIFLFIFYINLLTWPFAAVGWVTSLVQKAEASQARINEFLDTKPDIVNTATEGKNTAEKKIIKGEIEFRNVSFTYPDSGIRALRDVSFSVKQGQTLAIIGRTASGKSTIANLLCRMYDPTEGQIMLDGLDLKFHQLHQLRSSIGYVPQDVFLFSDSIANNIAFGEDGVKQDEIERAALAADVAHNIEEFPGRYETLLGERGINLSGGQKQRVSIARAIISHPQVLIFDDCLSAVDTETEENILNALRDLMKDKTSIIISHRISSIKHADKIIVLDHGRIAEEGTHDGLLLAKGLYATLHRKQLLEEAEGA
ncbi:MAG: ABC transporter ATP-binding protein [Flavobacteriales bacterium]|nr:ABC transporter ATP-binding protein [Flavobacteriales bacterium]